MNARPSCCMNRRYVHLNFMTPCPRVKSTRISVEFLLGLKAAGWSEAQILQNYPRFTRDDLQAVFAYAQSILDDESFVPIARAG